MTNTNTEMPSPAQPGRRRLLAFAATAAAAVSAGGVKIGAGVGLGLLATAARAKTAPPLMTGPMVQVWKGPSCECCKDWIAHLEANGFRTQVQDSGNTDARRRLGVGLQYGSCHTALVGGYALEGHVPAREIRRLLKERPAGIGLAVPAMPVGSPGMDGPDYGGRKDPYDVLLLAKDGSSRVFQSYR